MIGVITGSGLYRLDYLNAKQETVDTPYGQVEVGLGSIENKAIAFIARHGKAHEFLPNMINYRANIYALKEVGVKAIIATSVMGVVDYSIKLGTLMLFDDIYYPDNRLPDGEICTFFTQPGLPSRAHYIFPSPFSPQIRSAAAKEAAKLGISYIDGGIYAHVNGPRFNSRTEIRQLAALGVMAVSQTCGPEVILAGELEIPYQLIGFGIDYANGVSREPTPIEVLNGNLDLASKVIPSLIKEIIINLDPNSISFEGFLYRFE